MINLLTQFPELEKYDLTSLERMAYGGSPMAPESSAGPERSLPHVRDVQVGPTKPMLIDPELLRSIRPTAATGSARAIASPILPATFRDRGRHGEGVSYRLLPDPQAGQSLGELDPPAEPNRPVLSTRRISTGPARWSAKSMSAGSPSSVPAWSVREHPRVTDDVDDGPIAVVRR